MSRTRTCTTAARHSLLPKGFPWSLPEVGRALIRVWALPDGDLLDGWRAHTGMVKAIAFVDGDQRILSAGWDGALTEWDLHGQRLRTALSPSPIRAMAVAEKVGKIVTGHADGKVRVWSLAELSLLAEHDLHRSAVLALAIDASNGRLASSGGDGRVLISEFGAHARELPSPPSDARALDFSPDGTVLMGSGWFRLFRWQLGEGTLSTLDTEHHGLINDLQFTADGRTLVTISRQTDSSIYELDGVTGAILRRFDKHALCGAKVRLSRDGRYMASTSDDGSLRVWDFQRLAPAR